MHQSAIEPPPGHARPAGATIRRGVLPLVLAIIATACGPQGVASPAESVEHVSVTDDTVGMIEAELDDPGGTTEAEADDACVGALMTTLPLAEEDMEVIIPLGNLNPPGHTHPTDHLYYGLPYDEESGQRHLVEVRSPADGRITSIDVSTKTEEGVVSFDYSLRFVLCPERTVKFGHITELSAPLRDALAGDEPDFCTEYGDAQARYEFCSHGTDVVLRAGDPLGAAGGPTGTSAALDLWMYDTALAPNGLLHSDEHSDVVYTRCGLDYFTDEQRDLQYELLGGWDGTRRTAAPVCGEIAQDLPGTAQGNWYADADAASEWDAHLALVHDNVDPAIAVIAVGGMIAGPGLWTFAPRPDGTVNRDFASLAPGQQVFCFHEFDDASNRGGSFLIRLVDDDTMLVEQEPGSCSDGAAFASPVTYRRAP